MIDSLPAESPLRPAERRLRLLMRIWTALFAFGGAYFLVLSDRVVADLNSYGAPLGLGALEVRPGFGPEDFWLILAVAMMFSIAAGSWIVARDVRKNRAVVIPIVVSKLVSSGVGLVFFLASGAGPFLSAFLTDFPIALVTIYYYRQAR